MVLTEDAWGRMNLANPIEPFLHALCSYGSLTRAILHAFAEITKKLFYEICAFD